MPRADISRIAVQTNKQHPSRIMVVPPEINAHLPLNFSSANRHVPHRASTRCRAWFSPRTKLYTLQNYDYPQPPAYTAAGKQITFSNREDKTHSSTLLIARLPSPRRSPSPESSPFSLVAPISSPHEAVWCKVYRDYVCTPASESEWNCSALVSSFWCRAPTLAELRCKRTSNILPG